ncbi:hypothetical protein BC834DRAFT_893537 [Gloeopeniophorella convolvens]|nr:hypothetical protein BC834DRAFT_893537 [Gloeopeniophorella convolvens]
MLSAVNSAMSHLEALDIGTSSPAQFTLPEALVSKDTLQNVRRVYLQGTFPPILHAPNVTSFRLDVHGLESSQVFWLDNIIGSLREMPQIQSLTLRLGRSNFSLTRGTARVTLSRLSEFYFEGLSTHLEAVMSHFDALALSIFKIDLLDAVITSMPSFPRFSSQSGAIKPLSAHIGVAQECIYIQTCVPPALHDGSLLYLRAIDLSSDLLMASVTNVSTAVAPVLATITTLILGFNNDGDIIIKELNLEPPEPANWLVMLSSLRAVTSLRVDNDLTTSVAHALCQEGRSQLLPQLRKIRLYFHMYDSDNPCAILEGYDSFGHDRYDGDRTKFDISCEVVLRDNWDRRNEDVDVDTYINVNSYRFSDLLL